MRNYLTFKKLALVLSLVLALSALLAGCAPQSAQPEYKQEVVLVEDAQKNITLDFNDIENDEKQVKFSYYFIENGVEGVTYEVSEQSQSNVVSLSAVENGEFTITALKKGSAKLNLIAKVNGSEVCSTVLNVEVSDSLPASNVSFDAENIWDSNAGNPMIPGYIGDPYMFVDDDGTVYVYGTTDGFGDYGGDAPYGVWYTKDFVNWQHKTFHYGVSFPKTPERLWAPSVTKVNGKYYMAYIWQGYNCFLAEADSPLGPWTDLNNGNPIYSGMFDSDIVTFDSGTYIITMRGDSKGNSISIAKMKDDMSGLDDSTGSVFTALSYDAFEAPGIFERDGKWYLTYSNGSLDNGSYHVEYAMADDMYGPYEHQGTIIQRDDNLGMTTTGHNNVVEIDGDYYLCYHYKKQVGGYARLAGLEKLEFNEDGTIVECKPSVNGDRPQRTPTITEANLAEGARVEASSVGNTARLGTNQWIAQYAVDNNNGTLWQAGSLEEQTFTLDLKKITKIGRVETFFEYQTFPYKYVMEYSTDKQNWTVLSDRSKNMNDVAPMVDSTGEIVEARYIRLRFLEGGVGDRPVGIFEIKVYRTPAEATSSIPEGGIQGEELVANNTFKDDSVWVFDKIFQSWSGNEGHNDSTVCKQAGYAGGPGTAYQTITVSEDGYYKISAYVSKSYVNVEGGEGYIAVIDEANNKVLKLQILDQEGPSDDRACTQYIYNVGMLKAGTYKLVIQLNSVNDAQIDDVSLRLAGYAEEDVADLLPDAVKPNEDIADLPLN